MRITVCIASVLLLSSIPTPSYAWSVFAHELICQMAYDQLSTESKLEIRKLSKKGNRDDEGKSFAESCGWADDARRKSHKETYEYHFINVPKKAKSIKFDRDCIANDCVSQAVVRYAAYLSDEKNDHEKRSEALRFLSHFVGDLHQPLHVGFKEDLGGNSLYVRLKPGGQNKKLHAIWDGTIATNLGLNPKSRDRRRKRKKLQQIAQTQNSKVSNSDKSKWNNGGVKSWSRESYLYARECVYRVDCKLGSKYLRTGNVLSKEYMERAEPIVEERIAQASTRLAWILEEALTGDLDLKSLSKN